MFSLGKIRHSSATMDLQIIRFTFLLFLFQVIKSHEDDSEQNEKSSSDDIIKKLKEYKIEYKSFDFPNSTLSLLNSAQKLNLLNEKESFEIEKLKVSNLLVTDFAGVVKCLDAIERCISIMLGRIQEFWNPLVKQIQKGSQPKESNATSNSKTDALLNFEAKQKLLEEYFKILGELKTLKFQIYKWNRLFESDNDNVDEVTSLITKFSFNHELPKMIWNETDENLPPENTPDKGKSTIENIQRLLLLIQDELNEMPKDKLDEEFASRHEPDSLKEPSSAEGDRVPRWLLTKFDLKEIHGHYLKYLTVLENDNSESLRRKGPKYMREDLIKKGKSIKLFCKILAEYHVWVNISFECSSKNDIECEEAVDEIMIQPHYIEAVEYFTEWASNMKIEPR